MILKITPELFKINEVQIPFMLQSKYRKIHCEQSSRALLIKCFKLYINVTEFEINYVIILVFNSFLRTIDIFKIKIAIVKKLRFKFIQKLRESAFNVIFSRFITISKFYLKTRIFSKILNYQKCKFKLVL